MLLREYDFDSKNKTTFSGSDIMNIFPVVKHINPRVRYIYIHQHYGIKTKKRDA